MTSTLYETLILDSNRSWWRDGLALPQILAETTQQQRANFKFTRYDVCTPFILPFHTLTYPQHRYIIVERLTHALLRVFPQSAVQIGKCGMISGDYTAYGNSDRDAPCGINIVRPVAASILVELFAIPLSWRDSCLLQRITGVDWVVLAGDCQVIGATHGSFLPLGNSSHRLMLSVHTRKSLGLIDTMQRILQQIHPPPEACYESWRRPLQMIDQETRKPVRRLSMVLTNTDKGMFDLCLQSVST